MQNLQRRKFQGKDLSGFNFSNSDLRGANFSNTILRGADFTNAKMGMPTIEQSILTVLALSISVMLGFMAGVSGVLMGFSFSSFVLKNYTFIPGLASFFCLAHFLYAAVNLGYWPALKTLIRDSVIVMFGLAFATVYSLVMQHHTISLMGILSGIAAIFISAATSGAIALVVTSCLSIVGAMYTAMVGVLALCTSSLISIVLAISGISLGQLFLNADNDLAFYISSITSLMIVICGAQIGRETLKQPEHFLMTRRLTLNLLALGGTCFQNADLTDASFRNAIVKNSNFKKSILTRVSWLSSQKIETSRVDEKHYLENPKIQLLAVSCKSNNQSFDNINLEGINLQNASLINSSFAGSNLNHANLKGADLTGAKLKQTQLEGTDLTGAILTGAYIEDWGITGNTKLEKVECKYIYMRVPTQDNPNPLRKPDNLRENFEDNEFADFIKPYIDTLDLYHTQNIDPRAISIAFKNLSQKYSLSDLQIVAMEKRGNGFNLKVQVDSEADKSKMHSEYFVNYNEIRSLPEELKLLLIEKDVRIYSLENMITAAINQPLFGSLTMVEKLNNSGIYINADGNINNINGLTVGNVNGVINTGEGSDSISNTVYQLSEGNDPGKFSLDYLLNQLQQVIQNSDDLSMSDKRDLLDQIQIFNNMKTLENSEEKEGILRKAKKIFDATLRGLPATAKIVEAYSKLLPIILKMLGI